MQPNDIRQAVITGTTGGITGGDIVGPEQTMAIKSIHYSNVSGNTGNVIRVAAVPSGGDVDAKYLTATGNDETIAGGEQIGSIEHDNVLQVTTNNNNVVVRVAYTIEEGR